MTEIYDRPVRSTDKLPTQPATPASPPPSMALLLPTDITTVESPVVVRRSRHLLMAYALQAVLDGSKGRALDIISSLTDTEATELGAALDELYPMVAGRRAVQYADYMKEKIKE